MYYFYRLLVLEAAVIYIFLAIMLLNSTKCIKA